LPSLKEIRVSPIGIVKRKSPKEDIKDKNLTTRIILKRGLTEALDGIEDFSHIFVIFWLHKMPKAKRPLLHIHPRGRPELPLVGIFATRTPNRPNPIALTLVELVKREQNILWVKGLDALDQTPIIDIKPSDYNDTARNVMTPGWLKGLTDENYREI
jgi:tRNA-Thr(GGU) m(6)t(6)A37 methyltransferase TsaA